MDHHASFVVVFVTTRLGGMARLNCSTTTGGMAEWRMKSSKETIWKYIYARSQLQKSYQEGGRHNVSVDPLTGACDLVISNVIESDAGKYVCTEKIGIEGIPFELVVLLGMSCEHTIMLCQ